MKSLKVFEMRTTTRQIKMVDIKPKQIEHEPSSYIRFGPTYLVPKPQFTVEINCEINGAQAALCKQSFRAQPYRLAC